MSDMSIFLVIIVEFNLSGVYGSNVWPVWIMTYVKVLNKFYVGCYDKYLSLKVD